MSLRSFTMSWGGRSQTTVNEDFFDEIDDEFEENEMCNTTKEEEQSKEEPKPRFCRTSRHCPPNKNVDNLMTRTIPDHSRNLRKKRKARYNYSDEEEPDRPEDFIVPKAKAVVMTIQPLKKTTAKPRAESAANDSRALVYSKKISEWHKFPWDKTFKYLSNDASDNAFRFLPIMAYSRDGAKTLFPDGMPGQMTNEAQARKAWNAFMILSNSPQKSPGFRISSALVKEQTCATYAVPGLVPNLKGNKEAAQPTVKPFSGGFNEALERIKVAGPVLLKTMFDAYDRFIQLSRREKSQENFLHFSTQMPSDCTLTAQCFVDLKCFLQCFVNMHEVLYEDEVVADAALEVKDMSGKRHPAYDFKPLVEFFPPVEA